MKLFLLIQIILFALLSCKTSTSSKTYDGQVVPSGEKVTINLGIEVKKDILLAPVSSSDVPNRYIQLSSVCALLFSAPDFVGQNFKIPAGTKYRIAGLATPDKNEGNTILLTSLQNAGVSETNKLGTPTNFQVQIDIMKSFADKLFAPQILPDQDITKPLKIFDGDNRVFSWGEKMRWNRLGTTFDLGCMTGDVPNGSGVEKPQMLNPEEIETTGRLAKIFKI